MQKHRKTGSLPCPFKYCPWLRGIVLYMPRCSPILKLSLLHILTTYLFSFWHCHLFAVHILPAHLFSCFIDSLLDHLFAAYSAVYFYSLPAHLFSCFFLACPPTQLFIHSLHACPVGSAHLFSCLFIPCLSVYSVVYLFLPAHLFSCLFIPSRLPIQLFINSLPAPLAPKSPSTVYVTIYSLLAHLPI